MDHLLTSSLNALPALKTGNTAASISTVLPVRGLRPSRASRFLLSKVPKPMSWTFWPSATAALMAVSALSSAARACFWVMPASAATFLMSYCLFITTSSFLLVLIVCIVSISVFVVNINILWSLKCRNCRKNGPDFPGNGHHR